MAQLISIAKEVYVDLTKIKGKDSYSAVIRKLLHQQTNKERLLQIVGRKVINKNKREIDKLKPLWKSWTQKRKHQ